MGLTELEIEALLTYIRRSKPLKRRRVPLKWKMTTSNQGSTQEPFVIAFAVWTADLSTNYEICDVVAAGSTNRAARSALYTKAIEQIDSSVSKMYGEF
jgi:hypothetical protein